MTCFGLAIFILSLLFEAGRSARRDWPAWLVPVRQVRPVADC